MDQLKFPVIETDDVRLQIMHRATVYGPTVDTPNVALTYPRILRIQSDEKTKEFYSLPLNRFT